uniref:Uncharacterized protein n=1 Tax=Rhizophora mucronata TaxID=61149 RepID=A0A2P2Q9J6_RHIMU
MGEGSTNWTRRTGAHKDRWCSMQMGKVVVTHSTAV